MKYIIFLLFIACPGCTYNISMAHTSGYADDIIDDTSSNNPNVAVKVKVPIAP
jgi:hypothetical protein